MFIKIAILALYKRIFGHVTLANTLILSGVAFVCVFYIAMVSSLAAACIPHSQDYAEGGWSSASYTTRCQRYSIPLSATTGIVGAIIDIYILIVPQFFIWGLQTSRKRKASVSLVFIIGSAATIFSIAGAVYRFQVRKSGDEDFTWTTMGIYAMDIAEINSGVVCSCMPVIFVLFKGTLDKLVGWLSGLLHLITGHSRDSSNMGPNGGNDIHITLYKCVDGGGQELPQVPKGTVTGLRSFVRNFGRTDVEKTEGHLSTDGNMLTVVSEVYDYHQHFRDGAPWMGQSAST
ncbi:hypothetical protein VSDG_06388 [Cytospora chrysosperma]|uniref:Rhodopsin domain-containing protein n=1 Tax=Cytospora chrysosperma TaxID=252740 RepID=A0A423VPL4_CYTCH|nr:hypothetical protein VSDG_06388 [Valsa sordida]